MFKHFYLMVQNMHLELTGNLYSSSVDQWTGRLARVQEVDCIIPSEVRPILTAATPFTFHKPGLSAAGTLNREK